MVNSATRWYHSLAGEMRLVDSQGMRRTEACSPSKNNSCHETLWRMLKLADPVDEHTSKMRWTAWYNSAVVDLDLKKETAHIRRTSRTELKQFVSASCSFVYISILKSEAKSLCILTCRRKHTCSSERRSMSTFIFPRAPTRYNIKFQWMVKFDRFHCSLMIAWKRWRRWEWRGDWREMTDLDSMCFISLRPP